VPVVPVLVGQDQVTVEQFARGRGLDPAQLRKLNPGYKAGRIVPGVPRMLLTPTYTAAVPESLAMVDPEPAIESPPSQEPDAQDSPPAVHEVRAGDTLWSISRRYGLSMDTLRRINHLGSTSVHPGQKLKLSP